MNKHMRLNEILPYFRAAIRGDRWMRNATIGLAVVYIGVIILAIATQGSHGAYALPVIFTVLYAYGIYAIADWERLYQINEKYGLNHPLLSR